MHAYQHLQHFFFWLFHSQESWAGFIGAIVGALVGGSMTIFAAIRTQKQTAKDQRQRDREAERRAANDILRALETELRAINELPIQGAATALKNWETNYRSQGIPLSISATNQNYFVIFDSSAAALGRIEDNELRRKIIDAYDRAKGFVDAVNHHNQQYQEWDRLRRGGPYAHLAQQLVPELQRWTDEVIRGQLARLQKLIPELLDDIEKYLRR
jgi:hypothetical protein